MIINVDGDIGVIRTEKQFVIIINENIHGPFRNEQFNQVYKVLKDVK